ncbi:MAG: hypothetical protein IKO33_10335 [Bacteroidaceae bacterium]|nr:hypothetical protein [Bacteroidaceae bacterium]
MRLSAHLSGALKKCALTVLSIITMSTPMSALSGNVDSLMVFAGNIHQFNSIFPQEKVFVQLDNTSYYTGETIWFKAFVVNASGLNRAQSKVLYVDLISPTGILLKQEKLKIVAGQADGSFPLIDGATEQAREKRGVMNYPSGFYEIRAYTNYMQNFGDEILFSRVIAVYDKPKNEGQYYDSSPTITLRKSDIPEPRPATPKLRKINVSFYPEGGHLIVGKPCRVAFKVTDDSGFGIKANGTLQETGQEFSTEHNGMGSFTFTPKDRHSTVEITVDGTSRSFQLPQAETSGCRMEVTTHGVDSIRVVVDGTSDFTGSILGITLTCRGELMDFSTLTVGNGPTEKIISLYGVPEGVCRLNLFDSNGNIYASRSLYHRSQTVKSPILQVIPDQPKYGPFQKVALKLELTDYAGVPFRDRFCLSVRDSRGQGNAFADDLRTFMLLSSDLKGLIEDPSWYFEQTDDSRDRALDLLCMIQGWERYDWATMTGQKEFTERHRLEEGLTLNGWVLNPSGKKKLEGVNVLAALTPKDKTLSEVYTYKTDSSGYFGFNIGVDFYDKAHFTIDAHTKRERLIGTSARIQFDRSMIPAPRQYEPQELVFNSLTQNGKVSSSAKEQKKEKDDGLPTVINQFTGYLLPEVDIEEERMYIDYFTFNAFDVVKDVELDLDKGEYSTDLMGYLLDKGYIVISDDDGRIASINGFEPFFYVHNTKKYKYQGIFENPSTIDSKDIKSIIVFDRPMFLMNILIQCPLYQEYLNHTLQDLTGSDRLYQRLLLVDIQVKEDHELSTRKEIYKINKRLTTVTGYSRPYMFYSPQYPEGPVFGDVDYRRTLYWDPNVVTDSIGQAQVEFYNNSITTHFNISAAGITSSGIPYIYDQNF